MNSMCLKNTCEHFLCLMTQSSYTFVAPTSQLTTEHIPEDYESSPSRLFLHVTYCKPRGLTFAFLHWRPFASGKLLRVVFTYFTYFNGTIMFTCLNATIVFALACTSSRRYLRVVFTYFTDIWKITHKSNKVDQGHCADNIQQPSHRAGITNIDLTFVLLLSLLRCIEQELAHITA